MMSIMMKLMDDDFKRKITLRASVGIEEIEMIKKKKAR